MKKRSLKDSDDLLNIENLKKQEKYDGKKIKMLLLCAAIVFCISIGSIIFITLYVNSKKANQNNKNGSSENQSVTDTIDTVDEANITPTLTPEQVKEQERIEKEQKVKEEINVLIEKADLLAMGYDYDAAIKEIQSFGDNYTAYTELTSAIAGYEAKKKTLDPFGAYDSAGQVSHVFFHSLIADTDKAFDGDRDSNGYNYYMTTVSEFNEMMLQMYNDGYVLVSIHDVAGKKKTEGGTTKFAQGNIMLPPDKKPFVISQDDVNYYKYMEGDGFASRIAIDENGKPTTEMILEDGTIKTGDFDMVPVLETFIAEHPDFSYKGARGILALTGYEGTLGYRTNDTESPTYEQDKATVKKVAEVLKEHGWEFASHSYGHRDMLKYGLDFIKNDTDRWLKEVGSLIGETDIFIYPYGIEIETGTSSYSGDKYKYLKEKGFNYYCGVYKSPWIQINDEYVRMTRRPLDGQAMLQFPERLTDLFNLDKVIDPSRPALK